MNNQMPYNFMPPFGGGNPGNQPCHCRNEIRAINDRIDNLERQIRRLERRISNMDNNFFSRTMPNNPQNNEEYPNNYMI